MFGLKAIAGHSFLLAKARDINAPAAADVKKAARGKGNTATERGLESLLEAVSKSESSRPPSAARTSPVTAQAARIPVAQENGCPCVAVREEDDKNVDGVNGLGEEGQHGYSPPDAQVDGEDAVRIHTNNNSGGGGDDDTEPVPDGDEGDKRVRYEDWHELRELRCGDPGAICGRCLIHPELHRHKK